MARGKATFHLLLAGKRPSRGHLSVIYYSPLRSLTALSTPITTVHSAMTGSEEGEFSDVTEGR